MRVALLVSILCMAGCSRKVANEDWSNIEAGWAHVCGTKTDGTLACWGGAGSTEPPRDEAIDEVSVGYSTTCALTGTDLVCYGGEGGKELDVPKGKYAVGAPGRSGSCALTTDGEVTCWGSNVSGQPNGTFVDLVGGSGVFAALDEDGKVRMFGDYAVQAPPATFVQLSAGYREVCGVTDGGEVHCWADASVDDGDSAPTLDTPEGTDFVQVTAGYGHGCALDSAGKATCWGKGPGQKDVPNGSFTDISAGGDFTCAMDRDKVVSCWGSQSLPDE